MEETTLNQQNKKHNLNKPLGLYMENVLTRKLLIPYEYIGSNLKEIMNNKLSVMLEGKCAVEGFIKPNSIDVLTYSAGIIKGNNVEFNVVFRCLLCCPPEGMKIKVKVLNITKAGVRAMSDVEDSPIDVFVARDHNYNNKEFNNLKINDMIEVRILGQRYEINDTRISVISEIVPHKIYTSKK